MKKQASTSRGRGVPRSGEARAKLRAYPRKTGAGGSAEHALAALESFSMAGLASCHPATVERGLREVRALLAVARCAEADLENVGPRSGILDSPCTTGKLARALARLSRVSGKEDE